jgi:hypothetical protein
LGASVANFQKNIGPSSFTGTILTWGMESDYFCGLGGVGAPPPDASGTFSPSSSPVDCLSLKTPRQISAVKVEPDETTTDYIIQFYSDTGCNNEVVSVSYSGVECEVPPQGIVAFYVDYQVALPSIHFTECEAS